MNISTGGPHILLFERDQQLTALITSEFQLAGYECHAARTAVEVFDALARYPIRIVLVDLAQAAAARREFWVALDTQRRGRGIHVLTFRCSNIAGYGPRDPDERSQNTSADLEIDGMSGLMRLLEEVRNRVPGPSSSTNTIPRVPRIIPTPLPPVSGPTAAQRTGSLPPVQTNNGNSFRNIPAAENMGNATSARNQAGMYSPQTTNAAQVPTSRAGASALPPATNNPTSTKSASYTDKIRAVLYPNQRNWSTQGNTGALPAQAPQELPQPDIVSDGRQAFQMPNSGVANGSTVLQRLANGQTSAEGQAESGLAQLSRLAQANYPPLFNETNRDNYQQSINTSTPPIRDARYMQAAVAREQAPPDTGIDFAPVEPLELIRGNIGIQPLRASPIQDIPVDRPGSNQVGIEGGRRPDVLSRTNYGQQQVPTTQSPLASISASSPTPQVVQVSGTKSAPLSPPVMPASQKAPSTTPIERTERRASSADNQSETSEQAIEDLDNNKLEDISSIRAESGEMKQQNQSAREQVVDEEEAVQNQNTMLFDIMQSLPPMPPVGSQGQEIQAQVLSGRATRSLGSVLLAGHLVPQNRLEVAQNIQRMLRGVDLNYQLGEILLMFKLLTPDQLLAASLVSYGMITTAQVSALGRIRQELHSIGLEYDLESLLILFRILTPEQLREAKSGVQG